MSRLMPAQRAIEAASLGSFVVQRGNAIFTPWPAGSGEPCEGADGPPPADDLRIQAEAEAEAFSRGFDEGRSAAELELAGERTALARLAESLAGLRPEPPQMLALLLAETVDRLVREVVGAGNGDAALLLARAQAAAKLIGDEINPARLRAHPDDAVLLAEARLAVQVEGDPSLDRGSIVLETVHGWIEDGPTVRLDRLRVALDHMGAKP